MVSVNDFLIYFLKKSVLFNLFFIILLSIIIICLNIKLNFINDWVSIVLGVR